MRFLAILLSSAIAAFAITTPKKPAKKPAPKKYLKSVKPAPPKASSTPTPATPPKKQSVAAKKKADSQEATVKTVADTAIIPIENPAGLIPFFEQLYRHQKGIESGPVRMIQYGDSHTAADDWTNTVRVAMQERFGDGGSGYSMAGRPYVGYRRFDVMSGSTKGWKTDGLAGKPGDGIYGLGGISLTTQAPHEAVYVETESPHFELFYYQQPGGGTLQLLNDGMPVEQFSTAGDPGPAYYVVDAEPGTHKLEVETLDRAPVRLFGWVAEKPSGVTYEALGINGATASMILNWDDSILKSNLAHRSPALIVLAYGTNEAGRKDWTVATYKETFVRILSKIRADAPAATILVVGPPDRAVRTKKGWQALDQVDTIVEAERQASAQMGSPFWDLRAKMGGKGTMPQWVAAGLAQNDRVHLTSEGYRMIGAAMFRDLMSQYELFLKARAELLATAQ